VDEVELDEEAERESPPLEQAASMKVEPAPQGLLQLNGTLADSHKSRADTSVNSRSSRLARLRAYLKAKSQRHQEESREASKQTAQSASGAHSGTASAARAAQRAAMQRLFGRHISEGAHESRVMAIANYNRSKTSGQRWDLVTGAPVEDEYTPPEKTASRYWKLTAEQRRQLRILEEELESDIPSNDSGILAPVADQPLLMAVAGGIGASVGNTGSINFDRDLIRRMKMQDLVVMCLLMFVYFATLSFSACLAHRQAANRSRVKFYADPRMYISTAEQSEEDVFLEAFNQQPKQVELRVTGYLPVSNNFPGSFFWRDGLYAVAFSFALDLSPWVVRGVPEGSDDDSPEVGVNAEDFSKLQKFLASDDNDLAIVQMQKHICWKSWEELAMNIKHQIRQSGFPGVINIDRTETEEMCVYKNTQWANFMHGKALKVLLALSVVGWIIYVPYMWIRCTYLPIRCAHYINISIHDYWPYIAEGLGANGFLAGEGPQIVFPAQREAAESSEADSE